LTRDAVPRGVHLVRGSALVLHLPCQSVCLGSHPIAGRSAKGRGRRGTSSLAKLFMVPSQSALAKHDPRLILG
jgi:hypothetical protein